jgi:Predicted ATPases of PP-loop superfamily
MNDERLPIVLSWSGGKDSSLALDALRRDPRYDVVALLTSVTRGYDRVSIHGVRRGLLEAQARALGLPLHEIALEPASSNDAYEGAFRRGVAELTRAHPAVRHIAFGDLFLADVRAYRERLVASVGLEPVFPLWGLDTAALARRFIAEGYRARLVCVDTQQIGARFSGAAFDEALLGELPPSADPCGERGEFHTFVWDGPIFSEPVPVELGEQVLREERFAYRDLLPIVAQVQAGGTGR